MSPAEFAAAVNAALQAPAEQGVFSRMVSRAAAPILAAAGGGHSWQDPPRVHGWAGTAPRSFPLHLQHAGQCVSPLPCSHDAHAPVKSMRRSAGARIKMWRGALCATCWSWIGALADALTPKRRSAKMLMLHQ